MATPNAPPYGAEPAPLSAYVPSGCTSVVSLALTGHWAQQENRFMPVSQSVGQCQAGKQLECQLRSCLCKSGNILYIQTYLCICIAQVGAHNCQEGAGGFAGVAGWVVCASAPLDRQLQFAAMLRSCLNVCAQLLLLPLLLLWVSWEMKTEAEAKHPKESKRSYYINCRLPTALIFIPCTVQALVRFAGLTVNDDILRYIY